MSRKKSNRRGPIAGGVAGAAFGAMLAAALGDSMELLPGAAIGGVLGATAVRLAIMVTKGQKNRLRVAFSTGREADFYLNATPPIMKYIKDKVDSGLKVEGRLHFLPNHEFEPLCADFLLDRFSRGASLPVDEAIRHLSSSFALVGSLCLFIILVALWEQDFWPTFRSKLGALKKRFSWAQEQEQEVLWVDETLWTDETLWAGEPPSFVDIAKRLIKPLPASDQAEAYTLLVTELLPEKWARRPTFVVPRELFEKRVKRLANELQQAPLNQRLHLLRKIKCQSEIRHLSVDSLILAVVRYIKEHPDLTNVALNWLGSRDASKWLAMSTTELDQKASQVLEEVDKWDKLAQKYHPDIWEHDKLTPFEVQVNLYSAYSGSFHVAMGNFANFLSAVGAEFERIRLCY